MGPVYVKLVVLEFRVSVFTCELCHWRRRLQLFHSCDLYSGGVCCCCFAHARWKAKVLVIHQTNLRQSKLTLACGDRWCISFIKIDVSYINLCIAARTGGATRRRAHTIHTFCQPQPWTSFFTFSHYLPINFYHQGNSFSFHHLLICPRNLNSPNISPI